MLLQLQQALSVLKCIAERCLVYTANRALAVRCRSAVGKGGMCEKHKRIQPDEIVQLLLRAMLDQGKKKYILGDNIGFS